MANLANLNSLSKAHSAINPKLPRLQRITRKTAQIVGFLTKKNDHEVVVQTTRRLAIGLTSITLVANAFNGVSLAEDNGYWVTGLIPNPTVDNKISNEKTGTRSFLKKGLYMADIGIKNRMFRIRNCAFDLLALEDLIDKDKLNYVQKYLRLKSTFMYYDFDKVITATQVDDKQALIDLANKLFDSVEKLEYATKQRSFDQTETCYKDTKVILEEVMERMATAYKNA